MSFTRNRCALQVDHALSNLFRKLTAKEYSGLEADIVSAGGATDPVIACKSTNIILDGFHRWTICEKHQLPYKIDHIDIQIGDCAEWIINRQLHRRNLSNPELESIAAALRDSMTTKSGGKIATKGTTKSIAARLGKTDQATRKFAERGKKAEKLSTKIRLDYDKGNVKLTDKELNTLTKLPLVDQAALYTTVKAGEFKDIGEALENKGYTEPAKPPPAAEEPDAPQEEVNPITGKAENIHGKKLFKTLNSDLGKVVRGIDAIGKASKNKSHYNTCLMRAEELFKAIEVWAEIEAIG